MRQTQLFAAAKSSKLSHIVIIFLLAFAIRMAYLYEIHDNPFFHHLMVDEASYDQWGQRIASGEWLGKAIFYQDPLYPYFLGAIYSVFGRDMVWVRAIQLFMGSITCVLVYLLASSFFDKRTGLIAGVIAACYRPFFYFEGMFLKTFLGAFLLCLFLYLLVTARSRRSFLLWVCSGLTLGALVLVRANTLLLAGGVLVWLLVPDKEAETVKRNLIAFAGFLVGLLVVISSVCARNYVVGKDFVLLTSQGGQNFFIGNNPWNTSGRYVPPNYIRPNPRFERIDFETRAEAVVGRAMKPSEISSFWFGEAFRFIKEKPGQWLALMWRKTRLFWNWYEVPDNQNFYFFSRYSSLLRMPLPGFRFASALGLAGMILFATRWRKLLLLYLVIVLYSGTVIAYYVFGRYRIPMVPVLIVFAAATLSSIPSLITEKRYLKLGIAGVLVVVFAGLLSMRVSADSYATDNANAFCRLGDVYQNEEKLNDAADAYTKATEIMPYYWAAYYGLGQVYEKQDATKLAIANYLSAQKYNPGNPDIWFRLGYLYYVEGDLRRSANMFLAASELKPDWPKPHRWLAAVYKQEGDMERMKEHLRRFEELKGENE